MIDKSNEPPFGGGGMTKDERRATHERWAAAGRSSSALKPGTPEYAQYEEGRQCGGCAFYLSLDSDLGMDWGACANARSAHDGRTVFEHFTCSEYDARPETDDVDDVESLREIYWGYLEELERDTRIHSNPNMWLRHHAYKMIVALGKKHREIVGFIIEALAKNLETGKHEDYPGWWAMYALPEITGQRIKVGGPEVVHEDGFNKVDVMAVSRWWVAWGKENGVIQ